MNLIDENIEKEESESKQKKFKIIIISIIALIVLAIVIVIISVVRNNNTIKFSLDGESKAFNSGMFMMTDKKHLYEENGQIYISVKELASILKVDYYNDEYKNKGEDTTKCYIKTANEYTSFISDSSQIYKAIVTEEPIENEDQTIKKNDKDKEQTQKTVEYEYFTVENGVKYIDGEIYASEEAISLGFNVIVEYDQKNKKVQIYTIDGLEAAVKDNISIAVTGDEVDYINKKLLKYGYVIVRNADGNIGIVNYNNYKDGNYVVSCKYSNIKFCESSSSLIVTNADDEKVGIFKLNKENNSTSVIVDPTYQSIKAIDEDGNRYIVQKGTKYGIIEFKDDAVKEILKTEYQQIGVDSAKFNCMDNKYIINKKYIPVKVNDLWGLINLDGKMVVPTRYSTIGCDVGDTGSGDPVICIPELQYGNDGIVFGMKNGEKMEYVIIDAKTNEKVGLFVGTEIYSKYENNKTNYYMNITSGESVAKINIYGLYYKKPNEIISTNQEN